MVGGGGKRSASESRQGFSLNDFYYIRVYTCLHTQSSNVSDKVLEDEREHRQRRRENSRMENKGEESHTILLPSFNLSNNLKRCSLYKCIRSTNDSYIQGKKVLMEEESDPQAPFPRIRNPTSLYFSLSPLTS